MKIPQTPFNRCQYSTNTDNSITELQYRSVQFFSEWIAFQTCALATLQNFMLGLIVFKNKRI